MPVIDIHAHIYPEKIADKAVDSVGDFYDIEMFGGGYAEALLEATKDSPITHFVVHSVAMKPNVVESINDFIAEECRTHPEFIGFAALHQDYPNPEAEIERAIGLGLRGVKLHPDTQKVNMDDPRLMRIYEIIEGRLPLIVHTGDYRYDYSHPRRLQSILHTFPHLVVDAAHFGGWSIQDEAITYLKNENCFLDMSSTMGFIGDAHTKRLVDTYGADRILFGADFPMWNPTTELERFCDLGFSEVDREKMLWHNAERFLGMKLQ
ncbi:MAG: amidohydrolase family protein [Raoultibacter sp.]